MSEPAPTEDLADLYETAPCGYVSLSPSGRIAKVNQTLADWVGREPAELIGRPIHELLGFGGSIAFETHLAPLLRMQGYVAEIALDIVGPDGARIPTIANAAEKRDLRGNHLFTRLTLFKAVDRRTYERSLLESQLKAEAESKAERAASLLREQFLAVLGHDLRNPLSAVAAGIDLLERRESLSEGNGRIIEEMRGSIHRAMALIEDVLDLARGRLGGGIPVERRPAELAPVLGQVVAEVRSIAPNHRIESDISIPASIFCDPQRLGQLAANLLTNGVTHGLATAPVRFEAHTMDDRLSISVANAGVPIPEPVRDKLFQPFFRGVARPSRNGLGLGLFIASEIAKAHDGELRVVSSDEETRFTFTMPLLAQEQAAAQ